MPTLLYNIYMPGTPCKMKSAIHFELLPGCRLSAVLQQEGLHQLDLSAGRPFHVELHGPVDPSFYRSECTTHPPHANAGWRRSACLGALAASRHTFKSSRQLQLRNVPIPCGLFVKVLGCVATPWRPPGQTLIPFLKVSTLTARPLSHNLPCCLS